MKLTFKTPAKINLGLFILRKRTDGYHELETLFQMVGLYDEMEVECLPSPGIEFHCDHPDIPSDSANLAFQAARLLWDAFPDRVRHGVRIKLNKVIPSGAGLGGGSGNAAGTLMGLNALWNLRLTRQDLMQLAPKLGADVAFFLSTPCALGAGRGERLTPAQPAAKKFYALVVFPRFQIATAWVYKNLNLELTKKENNISILRKFLSQSEIASLGDSLRNDLEPVVIQKYPVIQTLKDELKACGAQGALMSGSGSAVFGVFENLERAKNARANLKRKNWDVFLTETISCFSEFLPEKILNYPQGNEDIPQGT
ncbi:MAG: 4-(cytidine 5'-diphospho)-2-C-methyl-D-erythritol kinase [Nitrospinales bacterium]